MKRLDDQQDRELVEELLEAIVETLPGYVRRPVATYRLQLNKHFGFADAAALVPYLHRLGITDLYASPCLKAAAGSLHGYDVVDHNELNPELGSPEQFDRLAAALAERGMGLVLDFVPNHMAIGSQNPYWMDVLENGPSSVYAHFFDIDWDPIKEELENRVLVPVLGEQYGTVLERGELKLGFENGSFWLRYYDQQFPVAPRQYTQILKHRIEELGKAMAGNLHYEDLLSIITALGNLPTRAEKDPGRIAERNREKEAIKRRLVALCEASPEVRGFIEENVRLFNGTPGDPRSFDLLDNLLREQAYRLAYWRVAAEEINYRRFFDINSLAAIRMEDPRVMQRAHALVFRLIGERKVTGLRIDHPDGLYCPADYFAGLQEELAVTVGRGLFEARRAREPAPAGREPGAEWSALEPALRARIREEARAGRDAPLFRPLYVVIEKILAHGEPIPARWAVHGSTGYEAMNLLNGILVERANARVFDDIFSRFTGLRFDWQELVYQKRRQTMSDSLSSELNLLVRQLNRISEFDRRTRDFTMNSLHRALVEVVACFPVYRTYLAPDGQPPDASDARFVQWAVARAKRKNQMVSGSVFDFIRDVMMRRIDDSVPEAARKVRDEFILKLQQVTAPVMAKSVEDTVFYLYNRLSSLNEVGGAPETFGVGVEEFHAANRERAERWPHALVSTTTHDTKRSEDVRARIDVLSEIPGEWRKRLAVWTRLNKRHKGKVGELLAPDRNEELLLYQTLLGVYPFESGAEPAARLCERLQAYMHKALREAKVNTTWVNQDEAWEAAVSRFVEALLDRGRSERFLRDFLAFGRRVARVGTFNSLSQLLLKIAGPGVPDVYQGQELWEPTLVDPDNRRPVDFARRAALLEELDARAEEERALLARELADGDAEGRIKLYVTSQALRLRRRCPELFTQGEYLPLAAAGERAGHVVAFARRWRGAAVLAIAPRLVFTMVERAPNLAGERAWDASALAVPFVEPGTRFVDLFTGRTLVLGGREGVASLALKDAFGGFPVVLALQEEPAGRALEVQRLPADPLLDPLPI